MLYITVDNVMQLSIWGSTILFIFKRFLTPVFVIFLVQTLVGFNLVFYIYFKVDFLIGYLGY